MYIISFIYQRYCYWNEINVIHVFGLDWMKIGRVLYADYVIIWFFVDISQTAATISFNRLLNLT